VGFQRHVKKVDLLAWCEVVLFVVHNKTQCGDVGQCQRCALGRTLVREDADEPVIEVRRDLDSL
jgi:hypothetical protein